jgi:hypothetical protein
MAVGCRCTCLENNKIGRVMDWTASIAKRTAWAFVITFELSTAWMTHAQSMPPVVNPRTYRAPAGRYELTIDPSEVYGCGPASYCLRFADRERWSETLPFTLCEAAVTDQGQVIGYGYSSSPGGFPSHAIDRGPGDFIVVILDANGATRLKETVKRQQSNFLHVCGQRSRDRASGRSGCQSSARVLVDLSSLDRDCRGEDRARGSDARF